MLDEVSWWRIDDLWIWAVDSLVVYVRVAAERIGEPVSRVCELLAEQHSVDLGARTLTYRTTRQSVQNID